MTSIYIIIILLLLVVLHIFNYKPCYKNIKLKKKVKFNNPIIKSIHYY